MGTNFDLVVADAQKHVHVKDQEKVAVEAAEALQEANQSAGSQPQCLGCVILVH